MIFSFEEYERIFKSVFRHSTEQPGFYVLDFSHQIDAITFRQYMVDIKQVLGNLCKVRLNKKLDYQSVGRFNHQNTSKLHRDTAMPHSFLMLGYEPTEVKSNMYIADYSRFIEDQGMTIESYFKGDHETNQPYGNLPKSYITQLPPFVKDHYRLLLLNNSKSFEKPTLGVFHAAEIYETLPNEPRILNYMMMYLCDLETKDAYSEEAIKGFVNKGSINN